MNKSNILLILFLVAGFGYIAHGDTGFEGASRVEAGSYLNTTQVTVSGTVTTQIVAANLKRPDMTCRNNSAFTLWVGSNTANSDLYRIGFPVISSETFNTGAFIGGVFGQGDNSNAVDVRCWQGLVQ